MVSTKASKNNRQASKSITNARKHKNNNKPKKRRGITIGVRDLNINASMQEQGSASIAYSQGVSSSQASFSRSSVNSTRIVHREQIDSVAGSVFFNIDGSFNINPGIASTFPWLSQQANGWEKYRFNSLRFCYYPRCATTTSGSYLLTPDYDSSDTPPTTEQQASNFAGAVEDAPWKAQVLTLRNDQLSMIRYIRSGALSQNQDIRLSDVAIVYSISTSGTDTSTWGKLWIEYDVTLMSPIAVQAISKSNTIVQINGSPTTTSLYGNATYYDGNLNIQFGSNLSTLTGLIVGAYYSFTTTISGTGISTFTPNALVGLTPYYTVYQLISGGTQATLHTYYLANSSNAQIGMNVAATTVTSSEFSFGPVDYHNI
jgi:hypothetical protein